MVDQKYPAKNNLQVTGWLVGQFGDSHTSLGDKYMSQAWPSNIASLNPMCLDVIPIDVPQKWMLSHTPIAGWGLLKMEISWKKWMMTGGGAPLMKTLMVGLNPHFPSREWMLAWWHPPMSPHEYPPIHVKKYNNSKPPPDLP